MHNLNLKKWRKVLYVIIDDQDFNRLHAFILNTIKLVVFHYYESSIVNL
jgi:hypothetical protein